MPSLLARPTHAPDFELQDHRAEMFHLDRHLGDGIVLVFYRGHWCPYCRRYLGKLRDNWMRITERGATVAAISPEPVATARSLSRELEIPFPLLSDPTGRVIDQYGVRSGFGAASLLPHPAVFILDGSGDVRFRSIDRNFKKRTTIRTILAALDELRGGAATSA